MQFIVSYKSHQLLQVIENEIKRRNCQSKQSWMHHTAEAPTKQSDLSTAEHTEVNALDQVSDVSNPVKKPSEFLPRVC